MTDTAQKGEREEALERISRLRRLLAPATPAPWRAMMQGNAPLLNGELVGQARLEPVPRPYQPRWVGFQNEATALEWHHATVMREEDAEFVAALRNNASWLFDTIERLLSSAKAEGEMRERAAQVVLSAATNQDAIALRLPNRHGAVTRKHLAQAESYRRIAKEIRALSPKKGD